MQEIEVRLRLHGEKLVWIGNVTSWQSICIWWINSPHLSIVTYVSDRKKVIFNTFSSNAGFFNEFEKKYSLSIQYNYTERSPNIAEMFSGGLHHSLASIEYGIHFWKKKKLLHANIAARLLSASSHLIGTHHQFMKETNHTVVKFVMPNLHKILI